MKLEDIVITDNGQIVANLIVEDGQLKASPMVSTVDFDALQSYMIQLNARKTNSRWNAASISAFIDGVLQMQINSPFKIKKVQKPNQVGS